MSRASKTNAPPRLTALVAAPDAAITTNDLSGIVTSWNRGAERLFGHTASDALGQSIRLIVPPDLHDEEDQLLARIRSGEGVDAYETIRLHKDGHRLHVSLTLLPLVTPGGDIVGVSRIARDIAERKRLERDAQHFAAIVESSEDAIISKDLNGVIVSWNRAAEQLFGYTAAETVGQSIRMIIPPDRLTEEDRVLSSMRRGEMLRHFETERLHKDGRRVPIALTVSPIRSGAGEIIGASKIVRDLTYIQANQRDSLRLAAIVDSSDDAIVSKDLNGKVTSWNAAAQVMFGYSSAEMVGQSIRLLIPSDRQAEEDDVLFRIRRGERVEHYETIRLHKSGTLVPVSLTVSPVRSRDGTVIGASKIARNISDRKRAEEERQRLLMIARDASRLKDEFLATLSHELRNPLQAIVGYIGLMQAGLITGEKQSRAINTVARNASSLTQIVEDVLDVSRIVSGKLRLDVQPVDLSPIVQEAVETMRPAADAKGICLEVILEPQSSLVSGDPERLRQILWNLLSNAVKFTDRGGQVQVRLKRVGPHVEVTVSDTGVGISPEFLPYAFDRFRQGDASIERVHGGLGLGLAISRHLVELQGGRISAESAGSAKGSTFRIELPLRSVQSETLTYVHEPAHTSRSHVRIVVPHLQGIRILAVDDDRDALALIREILEATGATVSTAISAQDALDVMARHKPDLLLADVGMPEMNGFDLIGHVRRSKDAAIREVPAVALTAFARSDDRAKVLRSGFQRHLSKPVDPGELMAVMADLAKRTGGSG